MTQYGDYQEPGIVTEVTSALGQPTAGEAPSDLGIVGQANLGSETGQGSADANTVYVVESVRKAREWFGDEANSLLTQACIDALNEGAFPVYAVAAEEISVTGEDHGSVSETSFTLDNAPVTEDPADVTITLDDTDQEAVKVYDDPSANSPAEGEAFYNPVEATVELSAAPSTNLTVDYTHYDYAAALEAMADNAGQYIDFLAPINENKDVVDKAQMVVGNLEDEYNLSVLLAGAGINIDPTSFENPYDDSRTQVTYGTRFADGSSLIAAYAGKRAALGIRTTPVRQALESNKRVMAHQADDLTRAKRGTLIDKNVVPMKDEVGGARIMDDPTTVTPENSDEFNINYGFERLVLDYIIVTARQNQKPFIGRLNRPAVRNTLESLIGDQLAAVQASNVILDYNVQVSKGDATTAVLDIAIETAEPLRFIENQVTVGQVA